MKTQTNFLSLVVTMMMGLFISASSWGQSRTDSLSMDEDQILGTIARYPAEMRAAILEVSQYPKVLVKLEQVQARSSQSFQDLVESLPRKEQEQLYQASRFPETISQLVITGKGHPDRIQPYIKDFPEDVQQQLFDAYNKHYDELVRMDKIYNTSQGKLETLTDSYPESVQKSFRKILANPDVMTLLTDNINLTVGLGNSYKSDPQGVIRQLDQMNYQLTEQNGKDLLAYREEVAKDPALQDEMKNAANDYAQQNNQAYGNPVVVNNYYNSSPYSYWFGYPTWYGSPMWYPYPYYYTGYYFGSAGIVITGLPSLGYSRWFYGRGYYNRYPRMYHCYNTYYNNSTHNIVSGYRTVYTSGNNSYNYRNSRNNNSFFGNHSRGYSQGGSSYSGSDRSRNRYGSDTPGNNSNSGSDRYSRGRTRGSQANMPNLQQGSSYNQPYQRYHASTYNPGLRSTGYGGRGFNSGYSVGRGFNSGAGSRGYSSGGFSGGGARGIGGNGGHGFGGGGGGRGRR